MTDDDHWSNQPGARHRIGCRFSGPTRGALIAEYPTDHEHCICGPENDRMMLEIRRRWGS